MSVRALYVGIDLGTTNSTAAVFDGETTVLVRNAQGSPLTPSVVRIDSRGNVVVGSRARRFLETDPQNTRAEFKRLMGTSTAIEFPAARVTRQPVELSAEIIKSLCSDVKEQLGVMPEAAVISVPALFELPQCSATSDAAKRAGLKRVELIQEPVASAIAAGWTADQSSGSWLVYDLGGGTFDASLLETRDGFLRVIGHDGDNFLGGRDFDWALVDWVLAELEQTQGVRLRREDASCAAAIRKIKLAAEDAKIELTRGQEAALLVPNIVDGQDLDLVLTRAQLEKVCGSLVQRSIEVCRRLLRAHAVRPTDLRQIVLVGGPTVMPFLRYQVAEALGTSYGEGLDPMTLVAQGAALYAATSGLDARPLESSRPVGHRVWLNFPAMSTDLQPYVVGRLINGESGPPPESIRLSRGDDAWQSPFVSLDSEGSFNVQVELLPRRPNVFRLEGRGANQASVVVDPASITIVQGLTISDPPLSRTISVALADDSVRVYFERGAPLPSRRSFTHHTVESVARGSTDSVLKIPIVQGEFDRAHLCRVVGSLEIPGAEVTASLPAGSAVELTLEVDRSGRLSARALVPALGQVFERVAHLLVPEASLETLEANLLTLKERLRGVRTEAFRQGATPAMDKLLVCELMLDELVGDVQAAAGGDVDSAQKAQRKMLEMDALLEEMETGRNWRELDDEAKSELIWATKWVAQCGSTQEQRLLSEVGEAIGKARTQRDPLELQRQLRLVRQLSLAAYYRHSDAWVWSFENAASRADNASDLPKAQKLIKDGRAALSRGDKAAVRPIVEQLWKLLPLDPEDRRLGHDSGIR